MRRRPEIEFADAGSKKAVITSLVSFAMLDTDDLSITPELGQASQSPFMVQRARKRTLSQRRPTPDDEFLILRQTLHAPYWIRGAHKAVGGLFVSGQTNRSGALRIQPNSQIK